MGNVVVGIVMFLLAAGAFFISFRSFREKGFLFNNAYIYASKQERERMDKKPYYHQSAAAFLMVGASLALIGLSALLNIGWISFAGMAAAIAAVVYAVVSETAIEKSKKN